MQLTHQFTVPASIDRVWPVLLDLERIAPCMPGAAITSFDGENFTGLVKVKLGPISMSFDGKGSITDKDPVTRQFSVVASGRDARGASTAQARISVTLSEPSPGNTRAEVVTDMSISGKAAQMGRGMIADVSGKLLAQFVNCLSEKFAAEGETPTVATVSEPALAASATVTETPASAGVADPMPDMGATYAEQIPSEPIVAETIDVAPLDAQAISTAPAAQRLPAMDASEARTEPVAAAIPEPIAPPAPAMREPEPVDLLAVTGAGKWIKMVGVLVLVVAAAIVIWLLVK